MSEEGTKHSYTQNDYWDERYGGWAQDPYDWLFEWKDVAPIVEKYVSKSDRVFLPGCGNAPLSPDMFDAGFTNQLNCDTSSVVIDQCKERNRDLRPGMEFSVLDATSTGLDDVSFEAVVDKSLIDTLLCCENSVALTTSMVDEFHRLLKPGGVYITMSLHDEHDTMRYFHKSCYDWVAGHVYLQNPNYEEKKDNTKYYLVAVCQKHGAAAKIDPERFLTELQEFDQLASNVTTADEESEEFVSTVEALSLLNKVFKQGKISEKQRGELKGDLLHGVPAQEVVDHLRKKM
jgi:SAM-dependent methyltransferase